MDLSKAFGTINYDLLIVKLHTCGVGRNALDLGCGYFENRKQRVKINTTLEYLDWFYSARFSTF